MWLMPKEVPLEYSAKYWLAHAYEEIIQIGERTIQDEGTDVFGEL